MCISDIGARFQDYQQYCDVVDETLASIGSPLMNGLPMARRAQLLIRDKRLSYIRNPDSALIFSAHEGFHKLYYVAKPGARFAMPAADAPIVVDQVRLDGKAYPLYDALMEENAFRLDRVNVGMERKLDDSLTREAYVRAAIPEYITVGIARPGELQQIFTLLKNAFDQTLDELPSQRELAESIGDGDVFVARDGETVAAAMIRVPRGSTAMQHWIVVDPDYRSLKLSGLVNYTGDLDSKNKGYHKIAVWVNAKADGWIKAVEKRGFYTTRQRLYTYVFHP